MSFKEFCGDKSVVILLYLAGDFLTGLLLTAFHLNGALFWSVEMILILMQLCVLLYEFMRRVKFYDDMKGKLTKLDKKYLIAELVEKPDFLEGRIWYETIRELDGAMIEEINRYKYGMKDFREYIELWIHEVKLPIASLYLILHNFDTGEIEKSLEKMKQQIRRIDNDVEQVLYYARSEYSEKDYRIKRCSLEQAVGRVLGELKDDFLMNHIALEMEDLDHEILTDSKWLAYILKQILSNSIKYSKGQNDRISIKGEAKKNSVTVHIMDWGIGISASDVPNIFGKSFTGKNGRVDTKATGIGLYLCKCLCDKLGHDIEAVSVEGVSTEISITFYRDSFYDIF